MKEFEWLELMAVDCYARKRRMRRTRMMEWTAMAALLIGLTWWLL